jgi:uncharacterized transporter YbjL
MFNFALGYFTGVLSSLVAASIIIVLSKVYDRLKEKKQNAINHSSKY